jgi:hypothetical protein
MLTRLRRELNVLRRSWALFRQRRLILPKPASAWVSLLTAASEELSDDSDLARTIPLPPGFKYEAFVGSIIAHARLSPDLDLFVRHLRKEFKISSEHALTAIDRAMGGVVRAGSNLPDVCPDPDRDPIAWHAYQICRLESQAIADICPGWRRTDGPQPA